MSYNYELGKIQIFFGKVHDQHDTESKGNFNGKGLCRCQIIIPGITDKLNSDLLPWYFPWYGRNYLPEKGDTVPVLIFDGDFSTGFYGRKIDLEDASLDPNDYNNYLEIFKRNCDGNDVQLTYKTSKGIEIFNGTEDGSKGSKVHLELDLFTTYCEGNSIKMNKDNIHIGNANNGEEWNLNGETTRDLIEDIINEVESLHKNVYDIFEKIKNAATNPYTMPIKLALTIANPFYNSNIQFKINKLKQLVIKEKTLSKMVKVTK